MDTTFERGTGKAPFVLASCLPNLLGGSWRFSLIVGVTDLTAKYYGGMAATKQLIRDQIKTVNQKFNGPGVFSNTFEFYVSKVYQFSTDVDAEYNKGHWGYDYRMVYDGYPAHGGGWQGTPHAIYHSWYITHLGGTFGADATDGLTHEFGHSRGAIDLYALSVDAANNPVNAQAYNVTTLSIMNYPYGVSAWDAHSISIINGNTSTSAPNISYITKAFPPGFSVVVNDAAGKPQAGVDIKLYPVEWYKRTLTATPVVTGQTDATGRFTLPSNPFGPAQPGNPWDIRYCNFLIEATLGTAKRYQWMPLDVVQNSYFAAPKAPFVATLTI